MKNKNKVILGVITLILVLTVGYALFSQNINITGTATAKGDFSLKVTCEKGLKSELVPEELLPEDMELPKEEGYENDSCSVNETNVSFHADLKYPGAGRYFTIKITNTGSIDAYWNIENGSEVIKNKLCIDGKNGTTNGTIEENECTNYNDDGPFFVPDYGPVHFFPIAYEKLDGTITSNFEELEGAIDEEGNLVLKSGESLYFLASASLDDGLSYKAGSFLITHECQYKLLFTQKTN